MAGNASNGIPVVAAVTQVGVPFEEIAMARVAIVASIPKCAIAEVSSTSSPYRIDTT